MTPEVTYKQNVKSPCLRCGAKKSVASISLPEGAARKVTIIRVCFVCWRQAVEDGYLAVYDDETESAASQRQDKILQAKDRVVRRQREIALRCNTDSPLYCRPCQLADHSGHLDGVCIHDNSFNSDCRCEHR